MGILKSVAENMAAPRHKTRIVSPMNLMEHLCWMGSEEAMIPKHPSFIIAKTSGRTPKLGAGAIEGMRDRAVEGLRGEAAKRRGISPVNAGLIGRAKSLQTAEGSPLAYASG